MWKRSPSKGLSEHGKDKKSKDLPLGRRPLKTIALTPPDYTIDPNVLLKGYVEKEVKYIGSVPNIERHLDPTNRTDILKLIDNGKRDGHLPWTAEVEHDAICCINAFDLKLSCRDGNEELLQRVPVHEIAACCYVRDGAIHIIAIKTGSPESPDCELLVLTVENETEANELCVLLGQCFQLVYTEASMQFIKKQLAEGLIDLPPTGPLESVTSSSANGLQHNDFLSGSSLNLYERAVTTSSSVAATSLVRSTPRSNSNSELSNSSMDAVHDYLATIQKRLTPAQLQQFADLIRERETMHVRDFCQRITALFGTGAKDLLTGIQKLFPHKYLKDMEALLDQENAAADQLPRATGRRSLSETGSYGSVQTALEDQSPQTPL